VPVAAGWPQLREKRKTGTDSISGSLEIVSVPAFRSRFSLLHPAPLLFVLPLPSASIYGSQTVAVFASGNRLKTGQILRNKGDSVDRSGAYSMKCEINWPKKEFFDMPGRVKISSTPSRLERRTYNFALVPKSCLIAAGSTTLPR